MCPKPADIFCHGGNQHSAGGGLGLRIFGMGGASPHSGQPWVLASFLLLDMWNTPKVHGVTVFHFPKYCCCLPIFHIVWLIRLWLGYENVDKVQNSINRYISLG